MQVVILCGGMGFRLREETESKPKPMVEIGGKPILWHIMMLYAHHGFKDFILCLGYRGDIIKQYFLNYRALSSNFTIAIGKTRHDNIQFHTKQIESDWKVTLVDTGLNAMTGARLKRIKPFIKGPDFMVTYGDGLANVDLRALFKFHRRHKKIGTITGVSPLSRFGELAVNEKTNSVSSFSEKPTLKKSWINGGFFVFKKTFFDYLSENEQCSLEQEPLKQLAQDGQLVRYPHDKFWHCMDTYRDYKHLNELWNSDKAPWNQLEKGL